MTEEHRLPAEGSPSAGEDGSAREAARPDGSAAGAVQPAIGKRALSRRSFLGTALGGAAALLAACGGSDPTPSPLNTPSPLATPTPGQPRSPLPSPSGYRRYFPVVANDGVPGNTMAQPTPTPEPTLTPTPTKTPTPEPPTPTPTPQATPFPPGPPSKLGIFVGRNDPVLFDILKTKAVTVVKTLELDQNFVGQIKRTSPNTKVIGRVPLEQVNLATLDPLPAAQQFVNQLLTYADDPGRRPYFDGWESYNEPVAGNAEEMKRYADFEAERTRLLGDRGIRSVIGNFGTGQPPLDMWQHFLPAVQAAQQYDGWLGLHEYSAPTIYYLSTAENRGRYPGATPQDSGWLTLRYRKVYNEILIPAGLQIPLVMTELGVDGLVQERPGPPDARGWKDFQGYWAEHGYGLWGPGAYIEQLVWYDDAMRQNDYVIGSAIFALAATAGWESYDIHGPSAMVLAQYLSVHAPA
ncbi:MAG: twin-arginine translocation signal domain-containing protein [Caldilineaceae bacterium]|nr:twin-arginine translocation signal domain-containing protein [Caldilineaceae bacterium]